jgi:hypothetical protein
MEFSKTLANGTLLDTCSISDYKSKATFVIQEVDWSLHVAASEAFGFRTPESLSQLWAPRKELTGVSKS